MIHTQHTKDGRTLIFIGGKVIGTAVPVGQYGFWRFHFPGRLALGQQNDVARGSPRAVDEGVTAMPTFHVTITRSAYQNVTYAVEADSAEAAEELMDGRLEEAGMLPEPDHDLSLVEDVFVADDESAWEVLDVVEP